jgi:transcriptional regulator with XRE-family HTH domain
MGETIKQIAQRLKGLRESLDFSLEEFAQKLGVNLYDYEKYESGESDIPMSVLCIVAQKLGVELTSLISGEDAHMSSYFVTRKDKGMSVERFKAYRYQSLAGGFKNPKAEPFLVTVEPQKESAQRLNTHPTQEFNMVIEGRLLFQIAGKELILEEGDSIYFDASKPHGMKALDEKPVKFLAIIL